MIIDIVNVTTSLENAIKEEYNSKKRKSNWVYIINKDHPIFLVLPKYRKPLYEYARKHLCTIQVRFENEKETRVYALNEKGDFKLLNVEEKK